MNGLEILDVCIEVYHRDFNTLYSAFTTDFARRYLPRLSSTSNCSSPVATIYWLEGKGFEVLSTSFSSDRNDLYIVQGEPPSPYINESPVFFLLQVLARGLAKKGYVMITDSISIGLPGRNILILGYPHTGKSTITTLAVAKGFKVYSTENTILGVDEGSLRILGGSRVLVYDPKVKELFNIHLEPTSRTKHGYEVVDLEEKVIIDLDENIVDEIYIVYSSFSSRGFSGQQVKGRKVEKTLWVFATSLLKGLDYYAPRPLDTPLDQTVTKTLEKFIEVVKSKYNGRFYEVFGSPVEIIEGIVENKLECSS